MMAVCLRVRVILVDRQPINGCGCRTRVRSIVVCGMRRLR